MEGGGLNFQMFMCKVRDVHMSGWIREISLAIFLCNAMTVCVGTLWREFDRFKPS